MQTGTAAEPESTRGSLPLMKQLLPRKCNAIKIKRHKIRQLHQNFISGPISTTLHLLLLLCQWKTLFRSDVPAEGLLQPPCYQSSLLKLIKTKDPSFSITTIDSQDLPNFVMQDRMREERAL